MKLLKIVISCFYLSMTCLVFESCDSNDSFPFNDINIDFYKKHNIGKIIQYYYDSTETVKKKIFEISYFNCLSNNKIEKIERYYHDHTDVYLYDTMCELSHYYKINNQHDTVETKFFLNHYDTERRLNKIIVYSDNDTSYLLLNYKNNLLHIKENFDNKNNRLGRVEYKYDIKNLVKRENYFSNDSLLYSNIFYFTPNNIIYKLEKRNKNNKLVSYYQSVFTQDSLFQKNIVYDSDSSIFKIFFYEYIFCN